MRRLYALEPRDRTGMFLGMSAVECALTGGGLLAAIVARLAGAPIAVALLLLVAGAGAAKLRVAGRPVREWVPLLAGWTATRVTGRRSWRAPLPLFPAAAGGTAVLPPALRGIDIVDVDWRGRPIAAVRDLRAARLTAVLPVTGAEFANQDPDAQDTLLASWGDMLGGNTTGASPIVQLGWSEVAGPARLDDHHHWAATRLADAAGAERAPGTIGDPAGYRDLVNEIARLAVEHDTVLWVTVAGALVPGSGKPAERAEAHLPVAIDDLVAALGAAGLSTDGPLSVAGLWQLLRARIDPGDAGPRASHGSLAARLGLVAAHNAGPLAMATGWSELRVDGMFHRVWWVESWPRRPQPGDWLAGFLATGEPRAMTVLHRPLDPERSQRRIESQLVKLSAHRARKEDRQRRVTEADERTEQAVRDLEAELASGYSEVLYLGLVTVTAATLEELDAAGRRVEQAARARGMGLRLLHGRQDLAWAASLPFGLAAPGLLDEVGL
jgi:hypothetical protein